jgi:hypothetical protein
MKNLVTKIGKSIDSLFSDRGKSDIVEPMDSGVPYVFSEAKNIIGREIYVYITKSQIGNITFHKERLY